MKLARWIGDNRWIPQGSRWSEGLVRDLERRDPKAYHKLLWEYHLECYGCGYEAAELFSSRKLNGTTAAYDAFVQDLTANLRTLGIQGEVRRVLDVGCSVGHVLRALELNVFPNAPVMIGIDIDGPAIGEGRAYLARVGSRIRLHTGDLERLDDVLGDQRFGFSYAAGSLSYLNEADARKAVVSVLSRTDVLAAFVGLANPLGPNDSLPGSRFRPELGSMWTHDFAGLVRDAGWEVLSSRWEPPGGGDTQGRYSVFAIPSGAT